MVWLTKSLVTQFSAWALMACWVPMCLRKASHGTHSQMKQNQPIPLGRVDHLESNKPVSLFCQPPGHAQIAKAALGRRTRKGHLRQISVMQVWRALEHRCSCYYPKILCCWHGGHKHPYLISQYLTASNFPLVIRKPRARFYKHPGNWTRSWCSTLCPSGNVVCVSDFVCDKLCILLGFNMALQLIGLSLCYCQVQRYHNLEKENKCLQRLIDRPKTPGRGPSHKK